MIDIEKLRQDFPILAKKINNRELVYLDNAATTQKPKQVIQAIDDYYLTMNANIHRGVHTLAERSTHAYESVREKFKNFINAKSANEIIFVRGCTEAINLVAASFGRANFEAGDEIVISMAEHHSNIVPWQLINEQTGAKLKVININNQGEIDLEHYASLLNSKTKMVAVAHVSNVLGTLNPVKTMIQMAHAKNIPFLVDGAQAIPHLPVDVQDLDCDFYTVSGHKMYAPMGIGVLYGKEKFLDKMPPYQGGGSMISKVTFAKTEYAALPLKFEAGTPNVEGVIGLGAAIDYLKATGMQNIAEHGNYLMQYATNKLNAIANLRIIGAAKDKVAVISFILDDIHPHDIATVLNEEGIAIRAGHHCAMPLMEHFKIPATARVSFGLYNNLEEIDELVKGVEKVKQFFHI